MRRGRSRALMVILILAFDETLSAFKKRHVGPYVKGPFGRFPNNLQSNADSPTAFRVNKEHLGSVATESAPMVHLPHLSPEALAVYEGGDELCPCKLSEEVAYCTEDGMLSETGTGVRGCASATHVYISSQSSLTWLGNDTFLGFANLTHLDITGNDNLETLSNGALSSIEQTLMYLRISHNEKLDIEPGALDGLLKVRKMDLFGNRKAEYYAMSWCLPVRTVLSPSNDMPLVMIGVKLVFNMSQAFEFAEGESNKACCELISSDSFLNIESSVIKINATTMFDVARSLCYIHTEYANSNGFSLEVPIPRDLNIQEVPLAECSDMEDFEDASANFDPAGSEIRAYFTLKEIKSFSETFDSKKTPFNSSTTKKIAIMADTLVLGPGVETDFMSGFEQFDITARNIVFKTELFMKLSLEELLNDAIKCLFVHSDVFRNAKGYGIRNMKLANVNIFTLLSNNGRVPFQTLDLAATATAKFSLDHAHADLIVLCSYKLRENGRLVFLDNMVETYNHAEKSHKDPALSDLSRNLLSIRKYMPKPFNRTDRGLLLKLRYSDAESMILKNRAADGVDEQGVEYATAMPSFTLDDMLVRLDSLTILVRELDDAERKLAGEKYKTKREYEDQIRRLYLREVEEQHFIQVAKANLIHELSEIKEVAHLVFNQTNEFTKFVAESVEQTRQMQVEGMKRDYKAKNMLQENIIRVEKNKIELLGSEIQGKKDEVPRMHRQLAQSHDSMGSLIKQIDSGRKAVRQEINEWQKKKEEEERNALIKSIFSAIVIAIGIFTTPFTMGESTAAAVLLVGELIATSIKASKMLLQLQLAIINFEDQMDFIKLVEEENEQNQLDIADLLPKSTQGSDFSNIDDESEKRIRDDLNNRVNNILSSDFEAKLRDGETVVAPLLIDTYDATDQKAKKTKALSEKYRNLAKVGRKYVEQLNELAEHFNELYDHHMDVKIHEVSKKEAIHSKKLQVCALEELNTMDKKAKKEYRESMANYTNKFKELQSQYDGNIKKLIDDATAEIDKYFGEMKDMLDRHRGEEVEAYKSAMYAHDKEAMANKRRVRRRAILLSKYIDELCSVLLYYSITSCSALGAFQQLADKAFETGKSREMFPLFQDIRKYLFDNRPSVEVQRLRNISISLTRSELGEFFESDFKRDLHFTINLKKVIETPSNVPFNYVRLANFRVVLTSRGQVVYSNTRSGLVRSAIQFDKTSRITVKSGKVHLMQRDSPYTCDNTYARGYDRDVNDPIFHWDCLKPYQDPKEVWMKYAPTVDSTLDYYLKPLEKDGFVVDQVDGINLYYRIFTYLDSKKKKKIAS